MDREFSIKAWNLIGILVMTVSKISGHSREDVGQYLGGGGKNSIVISKRDLTESECFYGDS